MRVERTLVGLLLLAATAAGCSTGKLAYNLPPASRLMEPGPGVGGPGPGVIPPPGSPYGMYGGAVGRYGDGMGAYMGGGCGPGMPGDCYGAQGPMGAAPSFQQVSFNSADTAQCGCGPACECGPNCDCTDGECLSGGGSCNCETCSCEEGCDLPNGAEGGEIRQAGFHHLGGRHMRPGATEAYADDSGMRGMATSQIAFLGDEGIQVSWDTTGSGMFDSMPLMIPGRQDFYQGAIYRLKISNIPGRPGVALYPTLEVAPVTPRTDAFLAHSPIPVQFTEEDFDQVTSGNFVTKVIYLPDPEFQELALAGVETLVSTRLDPGVDPIAEADRRGSILAILRIGNKNLEGNAGIEVQVDGVIPANFNSPTGGNASSASASLPLSARPAKQITAMPAQFCEGGGDLYGGACEGDGYGAMGGMPMGMPTSGFEPPAVPPNMLAGAPQWGMPITGTPIGLPGPPHIPLGVPAGLQQHVMKNRTRVLLPPPVSKVKLSVKQRPGLNYPRPVNHVHVDETQREPLRLIPGWVSGLFHRDSAYGGGGGGAFGGGGFGGANCEPYPQ